MSNSESPFKGKTGLRRLLNAFGYSIEGLQSAWKLEAAFRQVVILAVFGIVLATALPFSIPVRLLLILAHFICLIVELLNSAIEAAVDHTSLEVHLLAKRAKDFGSAAQLVSLCCLFTVWCVSLLALVTSH